MVVHPTPRSLVSSRRRFGDGGRVGTGWLRASCLAIALATLYPATPAAADEEPPPPFAKAMWGLEVARNYPASFAQNRFGPGDAHPVVTYRHLLDADWIMGLSAQFRLLTPHGDERQRTNARQISLWTVSHETYRIVRLDHPTYLLVGPKLFYLLPTRAARFPLAREPSYGTEIGAGLSVGIARVLSPETMVLLRADRWRGTRTTRFMGFEVAIGVATKID